MDKQIEEINACLQDGRKSTATILKNMNMAQMRILGVAIMAGIESNESAMMKIIYNLAALPLAEEMVARVAAMKKEASDDLSKN